MVDSVLHSARRQQAVKMIIDIIFGAAWGDEGKGKICHRLATDYDFVCRYNGGHNAGHTVYVDNVKVVTHIVPTGIVHNKNCVIGPNCVLGEQSFYEEVEYLKNLGFDTSLIKISPLAHVVQDKHVEDDKERYAQALGTTAKGIGPCYASKALREGIRASDVFSSEWLWDGQLYGHVLCEGAQSFWLDINRGNYPYVTSSECLPYSACSLGFSPKKINDIIAVAKMYDTRAGCDPEFVPANEMNEDLQKIAALGKEFGSTTGRPRSCRYLRLDKLIEAINISGANILYLNKGDILDQLGLYAVQLKNGEEESFADLDTMSRFLRTQIISRCNEIEKVNFDFAP